MDPLSANQLNRYTLSAAAGAAATGGRAGTPHPRPACEPATASGRARPSPFRRPAAYWMTRAAFCSSSSGMTTPMRAAALTFTTRLISSWY